MGAAQRHLLPDLSGKKILVTGGLGFIGSNIVHRCVDLGADVTIYDCLDPRSGGNIHNVDGIKDKIQIAINDLRNFEALCASVVDKDIIFNCAAYTSHPQAMKEPNMDIDVNCKGVINLLEGIRRFNPETKLVHIGTSTQIGKMHAPVIDELHPEFPVDIYSANKSASEKYVLVYGSAYKLRTTVIRLANCFGPRSNIRSSDFGFMNFFIGRALKGTTISVFGSGDQKRTIAYIEDCVDALMMAAQTDKTNNEVYFAVGDRQYTVKEIAESIVEVMGGKVSFVEWPKDREAIEVGDAIISNAKIKAALGWTSDFDLVEGLKRTKEYFVPTLQHYID